MMDTNLVNSRPLEEREVVYDDGDNALVSRPNINFEHIRSILVRNRWIICATVAACVLVALGITALMRPRYTAVASVQIDQEAAKVLASEDTQPATPIQDADRFLQTQLDVLRSRTLAERVALSLHLDRDTSFLTRMAIKPPVAGGDQRLALHAAVVTALLNNMSVELPRNSRVATISFISPSPQVAAQIANAYADQFIVANLQRRFDSTSYARNFLQGRLAEVRRRLENSERQVNDYARNSGLIDASNAASSSSDGTSGATGPRSLTVARLVELNGALVKAQIARTEAEERWNQAKRTPLMSLPDVLDNGAIQGLLQQRAQLQAAYEEEKQRRKDAYPTMVQEAARISALDQQINLMASNVRRSISDAYQSTLAQERETAAAVTAAERLTRSEQDRGVGFNILRREVDTNRELYNGLLQRFKELSAQAGVTTNNISIVDRALAPVFPTSPKLWLNVAAGVLLGLLTATALVALREIFDDRVRLPEDVPAKLQLPLMGSIPRVGSEVSMVEELESPKSEIAEAYQALRATLELSSSRGVPRSLLMTSSRPSEGKSTSAYAVARAFARQGRKVVLVDGDLRRPSAHRLLGLDNQLGLSNVLSGQQPIKAVVKSANVPGLSVITSGPIPPDPTHLLDATTVRATLDALSAEWDLIVLDAPPVLGLADTLELAAAVEAVLFVVEASSMHFGGVRSSLKRLRDVRANLLGVVLNKFDAKAAGYSTDYSYSYTYRYGSTS